jgi:hypothetical protein
MVQGKWSVDEWQLLKPFKTTCQTSFAIVPDGTYEHLGNGWRVANQIVWYKKHKQQTCGAFEIYRNKPPATPPSELRTNTIRRSVKRLNDLFRS